MKNDYIKPETKVLDTDDYCFVVASRPLEKTEESVEVDEFTNCGEEVLTL